MRALEKYHNIYKYYSVAIFKMNFNKAVTRNCPGCNSTNIKSSISVKCGRYVQKIDCLDCPYRNNRDVGSAEDKEVVENSIDEEQ